MTEQKKSDSTELKEPMGGLWAYHDRSFYGLQFTAQNKHMDHVTWFPELELPDYGPEFDRILRGRMLWEWSYEHFVLTFYGTRVLSNRVYKQVSDFFNPQGLEMVERPATDRWM